MNFPREEDGSSATVTVAELIAGLVLPSIEPLSSFIAGFSFLPPLPYPSELSSGTPAGTASAPATATGAAFGGVGSQLEAVQLLLEGCTDAVAALRVHQNQGAGLAAVLIERCAAVAAVEDGLLSFDAWQRQQSFVSLGAELAGVLRLTEGATARLMEASTVLVRKLPTTLNAVCSGVLGWDFAIIIVEEATVLAEAGVDQDVIDAYERTLLGKAAQGTVAGFREKARRLRERSYPETLSVRTRKAYADRQLRISRDRDGMSWLSMYAPSPTIEGIWDQCTLTAQAAQGPHEDRTLTQLRTDVAAALLLNQSMAQNTIHSPPTPTSTTAHTPGTNTTNTTNTANTVNTVSSRSRSHGGEPDQGSNSGKRGRGRSGRGSSTNGGPDSGNGCSQSSGGAGGVGGGVGGVGAVEVPGHQIASFFDPVEPDPCAGAPIPDPDPDRHRFPRGGVPVFDDPDYQSPSFKDPDHRHDPDWLPTARPPTLTPPTLMPPPGLPETGTQGTVGFGAGTGVQVVWPPLPKVLPVVVIPALSLLGATNEPAWMEGAGPISIEVARKLLGDASCFYRVLTDPVTNTPLDSAPQQYRLTQAMRLMLRIRDEYCQFPGCLAHAIHCQIDHVKAFEHGGPTILDNLETLCRTHHLLKHFKDDRTRTGQCRIDQSPERAAVRLRGWTPTMTAQNGVAWTSPRGRYYPPETPEPHAPAYPKWLKKHLTKTLNPQTPQTTQRPDNSPNTPAQTHFNNEPDHYNDRYNDCDCYSEDIYASRQLPEPPPGTFPDDPEYQTLHWENLIQRGHENPTLGLPR